MSVAVKRDPFAAFWAQEMTDIGSPGARALHLERLWRVDRVTATRATVYPVLHH